MGSKNLKAVAITATRNVRVFDEERFKKIAQEQAKCYRESDGFRSHHEWGTTATQDVTNTTRNLPYQEFQVWPDEGRGEDLRE